MQYFFARYERHSVDIYRCVRFHQNYLGIYITKIQLLVSSFVRRWQRLQQFTQVSPTNLISISVLGPQSHRKTEQYLIKTYCLSNTKSFVNDNETTSMMIGINTLRKRSFCIPTYHSCISDFSRKYRASSTTTTSSKANRCDSKLDISLISCYCYSRQVGYNTRNTVFV